MVPNTPQTPWGAAPRKSAARRWTAGAASALAAALLAGGGVAVALQSQNSQPQASAASDAAGSDAASSEESPASLTSLDELGSDVASAENGIAQEDVAQPAAFVAPAAATSPSPSASGSAAAKHPARTALRRALAVIIRQDGQEKYGDHARTAARALINRFPGAFRKLPEKLRQDLWTLAGASDGQEVADAHAIKDRALDGTYGAAVQKLAQAIQTAPAKPKAATPAPNPSGTPTPSPTTGS
ncbi:MAG: hypothetical protein HOQ07_07865 [Sinomonas sp.]|nr:hypothetical protein [Sinomonas sp.]